MSESKSDALPLGYEATSVVERNGFEPLNSMRADLQSAAFSHFAISPIKMVPKTGIEPVTY